MIVGTLATEEFFGKANVPGCQLSFPSPKEMHISFFSELFSLQKDIYILLAANFQMFFLT